MSVARCGSRSQLCEAHLEDATSDWSFVSAPGAFATSVLRELRGGTSAGANTCWRSPIMGSRARSALLVRLPMPQCRAARAPGGRMRARCDGCRAIVLSGRPGMFTAGLDVPELLQLDRAQMLEAWKVFFGAQARLAAAPLPVAAAITGHSPAGGAVLALYCDYRVMADRPYQDRPQRSAGRACSGPGHLCSPAPPGGAARADQLVRGGLLLSPGRRWRSDWSTASFPRIKW